MIHGKGEITKADLRRRWPHHVVLPADKLRGLMNSELHKFTVGQTVQFAGPHFLRAASGPYEITRLVPHSGGEFQYRIKNSKESYERIARESQLTGL